MTDQSPFVITGLAKSYGALKAVDGVSFSVNASEIVGFCGPNGAGKTTLFDLITGLVEPDSGTVCVEGDVLSPVWPEQRVRCGVARTFQLNAAFGSLTVAENLALSAYFGRTASYLPSFVMGRGHRRHAVELGNLFELGSVLNQLASSISVLQLKLLMLASAFASRPRFILLDEPVAGLSPGEIDFFRQMIIKLNREHRTTFLIIEHVMPFLMAISTRMIFLHNGRIEFDGQPAELARNGDIVALYLGATAASVLQRG
jgi:branched-chain amino acid transport system ATP-binding protein